MKILRNKFVHYGSIILVFGLMMWVLKVWTLFVFVGWIVFIEWFNSRPA